MVYGTQETFGDIGGLAVRLSMVQVPKRFVDETLRPEFQKINSELNTYLQEITSRIVTKVLHEDSSDAEVVEEPLKSEPWILTSKAIQENQQIQRFIQTKILKGIQPRRSSR